MSSRSPPRKRVRQTKDASAADMITSGVDEEQQQSNASGSSRTRDPTKKKSSSATDVGSPTADSASSSADGSGMKIHKNSHHHRHRSGEECSSASSDFEDGDGMDSSTVTSALLKKIPRRSGLSKTEQEVVRLIGQHLTNIGLKSSAEVLMQESGCRLDEPQAARFRRLVMSGNWTEAVKTLEELTSFLENPENLVEMKFLLLEQKYLEYLSHGNSIEALKVLQTELTPLKHNQARTHELSSYLMYTSSDDIARVTRLSLGESRHDLMDRLQGYLPASIMLPPRRLTALLGQAQEFQTDRCLYHNSRSGASNLDPQCLLVDHSCSKEDFPCETLQVLTEHCDEVYFCKFSPDGLKLATGSKDMTVIVWDFDPNTLKVKHNRTLEGHSYGVSYFAWSPDSTKLAVCGPEDCEEVCIWNVETGTIEGKISHSSEDSLTTVSWSPDGRNIACGGSRGNFYQCDTSGIVKDSWEGVRVQCLAFRKDGKAILAADTHYRLRSYNFEDLSDHSVLTEDHGIMSFSVDDADRHVLLNIANQGIHMWDIEEKCLIRKFVGITQGFYTIHSCFGGIDQTFVASGSEDQRVYIYHVKRDTPIAVLAGHTRTVNCVSWNPVYPKVLVSASDDNTVRVWGPSERYRSRADRTPKQPMTNGASHSNGVS